MISELSAFFRTLILGICFSKLWSKLIERENKRRKLLFHVVIITYMMLLDLTDFLPYIKYLLVFAVCILYCYHFKLSKWEKPIFLLLFLYNLHTMAFLSANSIYQICSNYMLNRLDMNAPDIVEKIYLQTGIMQIVFMILYAAILAMLCFVFIRSDIELADMTALEFVFLTVLCIAGIIFAYLVVGLSVVPLEDEVFLLYDRTSGAFWKIPAIAILMLMGEYASIFIFSKYKKYLLEREGVISRELELRQLESRMEEAQTLYGNLRGLRHDIKNHMQIVQNLMDHGKIQDSQAYMDRLNEMIESIDGKFCTGNMLCDVILNDKYRLAKNDHIEMTVEFQYDDGISDFDLGIILSNLCDNAIEACKKVKDKERNIAITFHSSGPCVLMTVRNTYDGKKLVCDAKGIPVTTKMNDAGRNEFHGMGLKNVMAIADDYYGKVQIDQTERDFIVTVMLQKREQ